MKKLRALSVISAPELALDLKCQWEQLPGVGSLRHLSVWPNTHDLRQAIRADKADVLFVQADDLSRLEVLLADLDELVPVIGVGSQMNSTTATAILHVGVR